VIITYHLQLITSTQPAITLTIIRGMALNSYACYDFGPVKLFVQLKRMRIPSSLNCGMRLLLTHRINDEIVG